MAADCRPRSIPTGNGLNNLRERMSSAGGTLELESAGGAGTRIRCTVPVPLREGTCTCNSELRAHGAQWA